MRGAAGGSIFLRGAGSKDKEGKRWSSSPWLLSSNTYGKSEAYGLRINKAGDTDIVFDHKFYGYTVRGVIDL